jgi:hypothetical protein
MLATKLRTKSEMAWGKIVVPDVLERDKNWHRHRYDKRKTSDKQA